MASKRKQPAKAKPIRVTSKGPKAREVKWYGWRPGLPDKRDDKFRPMARRVPTSFSLRQVMPPVYNQGTLGSCVANSVALVRSHVPALANARSRHEPFAVDDLLRRARAGENGQRGRGP